MATHASVDAGPKAGLKLVSSGQPASTHGMRRTITRQQGAALEMIGHAVDYLHDCYINQGADNEILDSRAPEMVAVQILISAQRQMLHSLPLTEPLTLRLWHALLRRKPRYKSAAVVPLSSSR